MSQWFLSEKVKYGRDIISKYKYQTVLKVSLSPSSCTLPLLSLHWDTCWIPRDRHILNWTYEHNEHIHICSLPGRKLTHDNMHQFFARWVQWMISQGSAELCSWHRHGALWARAGEERRLKAKGSSCLYQRIYKKYTKKQQVSLPLLLPVFSLQALSHISVATTTLKHRDTFGMCQAHTTALYCPESQFAALRN